MATYLICVQGQLGNQITRCLKSTSLFLVLYSSISSLERDREYVLGRNVVVILLYQSSSIIFRYHFAKYGSHYFSVKLHFLTGTSRAITKSWPNENKMRTRGRRRPPWTQRTVMSQRLCSCLADTPCWTKQQRSNVESTR